MDRKSLSLRDKLVEAGFSNEAIGAAWPTWWSEKSEQSPSSQAELRFSVARKLGLSPTKLIGDRVDFVWKDQIKYKGLSTEDQSKLDVISAYSSSVGQLLARATKQHQQVDKLQRVSAAELRRMILSSHNYVDLRALLITCWSIGLPVAYLRVFPLDAQYMHATATKSHGHYAILLARNASYPAPVAFTLAHEIGHIALRHLKGEASIVELKDPLHGETGDAEEDAANAFALELLTGSPEPRFKYNIPDFNSVELADAVMRGAAQYRIEPGTLALAVGFSSNRWIQAQASLKKIYSEQRPVWVEVNRMALAELHWSSLPDDMGDFLSKTLNLDPDLHVLNGQ